MKVGVIFAFSVAVIAIYLLFAFILTIIEINSPLGFEQLEEKQIDELVDCSIKFCEERGLDSRIQKRREGYSYLTYDLDVTCYDREGKEIKYKPEPSMVERCQLKPEIPLRAKLNIFYYLTRQ